MRAAGGRRCRARVAVALVALAAAGAVLAGCGVIRATRDTSRALYRAGFHSVSVNVNTSNRHETVNVDASVDHPSGDQDATQAAQVVWATFRYRVDEIDVDIHGSGGDDVLQAYSRSALEGRFGPRDPAKDRRTLTSAITSTGKTVAIVIGLGGLLFVVFVIVLIVFLIRSSRRRPAPPPAVYGPPAWGSQPPPGWPPPGPGAWPPPPGPPGWPPPGPGPGYGDPGWPPPPGGTDSPPSPPAPPG